MPHDRKENMYLPQKDIKNKIEIEGLRGLPEHYPTPDVEDMLFYVQRNQNANTVVYKLNRCSSSGRINTAQPLSVFWKNYTENRPDAPINYFQKQLAYGYNFDLINNETIQLSIISYPVYKIFLTKCNSEDYKAVSKINGVWAHLSNAYVFADESGAFPVVRYLELYGQQIESGLPCYEKILIG